MHSGNIAYKVNHVSSEYLDATEHKDPLDEDKHFKIWEKELSSPQIEHTDPEKFLKQGKPKTGVT